MHEATERSRSPQRWLSSKAVARCVVSICAAAISASIWWPSSRQSSRTPARLTSRSNWSNCASPSRRGAGGGGGGGLEEEDFFVFNDIGGTQNVCG
jgi:hypothetical protein